MHLQILRLYLAISIRVYMPIWDDIKERINTLCRFKLCQINIKELSYKLDNLKGRRSLVKIIKQKINLSK